MIVHLSQMRTEGGGLGPLGLLIQGMVGRWEQRLSSSISATVTRGERSKEGSTICQLGPRAAKAPKDRDMVLVSVHGNQGFLWTLHGLRALYLVYLL